MFPSGRSSQSSNMPGGKSAYPSTYYRDVAAVSNPAWFGNNPAPVPPPVQYPSRSEPGRDSRSEPSRSVRAESGRDLLAESYERMRNEMRSLQGDSTSKYGGGLHAPPPPNMEEEKANPLTQLLENKDVSLSSLLEAAMDPNIGSSKRKEDPIMKKTILDKCEGKIAQLYRLRISGQGMFFPMAQPRIAKFDGVSTLTHNHPRIEFNMVPEETIWMCPDVVLETKKEEPPVEKKSESEEKEIRDNEERNADREEKDRNASNPLDKIDALVPRLREEPPAKQTQQQMNKMLSQPPPPIINVSYPVLSQYRTTVPPLTNLQPSNPYAVPPPVIPNPGLLPLEILADMEKERRRKEIEIEWDRLMQDKERKEKRRKKKKRSRSSSSSSGRSGSRRSKSHRSRSRQRSHSRGRSSHRRSRSRHRTHDRSRERRHRRRSRSLSLSLSPSRRRSRSPLRVDRRYRRSPSPRVRRRSPSFLRSLQDELRRECLLRSPPRYRPREDYPPPGPDPVHSLSDVLPRPREEYPPVGPIPLHPYADPAVAPPGLPPQPGPPGFDNYYNPPLYGFPANPPPPGMDDYGPQYHPGMTRYEPMGSGPHGPRPWPWVDPNMGPPPRGPWPGPDMPMYRFGPRPPMRPMGPRGPMPPNMLRKPAKPKPTPPHATKTPNVIDVSQPKAITKPAVQIPVAIVDITDDSDKPLAGSAKADDKNVEAPKNKSELEKLKATDGKSEAEKPTLAEKEVANKAKVISDIIPPGVSPERESHTRYPNVESEFTRPMRAAFRKMLEPLEKVLNKIRLYQRDSFDFKTLIKSLESGKIEFMGVHTLHDGLLCKLEINRKHPDKFFKVVVPSTHTERLLKEIHTAYHDYSIGRIQRLIENLFNDPHQFSLSKIISIVKRCKECIKAEEKEREKLRKKEILILDSPEPNKKDADELSSDAENEIVDPMVKPRKDHRQRRQGREDKDKKRQKEESSRRPSDAEKEEKSRRDSEKSRTGEHGENKNKSQRKSSINEADTYSKFEDLGVSRKTDDAKTSPSGEVAKTGVPDVQSTKPGQTADRSEKVSKNGKKVPVSAGASKAVSKNDKGDKTAVSLNNKNHVSLEKSLPKAGDAKKESGDSNQLKSSNKLESKLEPKPQQKPTVNPEDFKERVRTVQMGVAPLDTQISDLEGLGKKSSDPGLLLKAGMLCRRLPPPSGKGKPEVKIVVNPACLKQMVEIVHTMSSLHAPLQKTVTVFNKHFVPIDGLEKVVSEVLNSCAKCSSGVKK